MKRPPKIKKLVKGGNVQDFNNNPDREKFIAYNDSLEKFEDSVKNFDLLNRDLKHDGRIPTHIKIPFEKGALKERYKNEKIKPIAFIKTTTNGVKNPDGTDYIWETPLYKRPTLPVKEVRTVKHYDGTNVDLMSDGTKTYDVLKKTFKTIKTPIQKEVQNSIDTIIPKSQHYQTIHDY